MDEDDFRDMTLAEIESGFELDFEQPGDDEFDDLLDFLDMDLQQLLDEIDFQDYPETLGWYH